MASGWILAIDFGTSNTAAAHVDLDRGSVHTVALSHHGNLMPSAVFVESPQSILVGDVAIDRAQSNPAAFVPAPKRHVGQGRVRIDQVDIPDSVLVAAVLRSAIGRAVAVHNGQPPQQLVLTHPVAWSPQQIQSLVDAAAQVGFGGEGLRVVPEPVAAAHYYTRTETLSPGARIAVFDFGGGTLDIAALTATSGDGFEVSAARGDNRLGGRNLDAAIRNWVDRQLDDRNPDLRIYLQEAVAAAGDRHRVADAVRALRHLDESIRAAKELLSEAPSATITVTGNGMQETLSMTRDEFEDVIGQQIHRAIRLTHTVFDDANLTGSHPTLYLTGGSSRIPLIHEQLRHIADVATLDDPKTVVVRGALDAIGATRRSTPPTTAHGAEQSTPAAPLLARPDSAATRRRRSPLLIAAAIGIAVVVTAGAVYALTRSDDTSSAAPGGTTDATTAAAPDTASPQIAKTVNGVLSAIPPALDRDSSCQQQGFTPEGAIEIYCTMTQSASTTAGLSDESMLTYMATVDPTNAAEVLKDWESNASGDFQGSDTARALIAGSKPVSFTYANSETGLGITMRGFRDRAAATTFLERTALI